MTRMTEADTGKCDRGFMAAARLRLRSLFQKLFPHLAKSHSELGYWRSRYAAENGDLGNSWYEELFTVPFDLRGEDYAGKRVLDIGCGPRGSLEWADMVLERVGADPLVPQYLKLGAGKHAMRYVAAPSERMPFDDGHFDIVICVNALDHVDDFPATVKEIKRVTAPSGLFLLSVEIGHPPTPTEPISLSENALKQFAPEFSVISCFKVGTPSDHDINGAAISRSPVYVKNCPGVFVAKYRRA